MSALLEDYLDWLDLRQDISPRTVEAARHWLRHADRHLPQGVERASDREIARYLRHGKRRDGKPWAPWTIHTADSRLRDLYRYGAATGRLVLDPMIYLPKPPQGARIPHPCSDDDLRVALTAPQWPWRRAVMLAMYAGLRCAEICTVTADDITGGILTVYGKGGKSRPVPVAPALAAELDGARGYLCVGNRARPMNPRHLTQMQRPVWDVLGLPRTFTLHAIRHWFATRLLENGADLVTVQHILGHADPGITTGYTLITDKRMVQAVHTIPTLTEGDARACH